MKTIDTLAFDPKADLLWRFDAIHGYIDIRDVIDATGAGIIAKLLKSPILERLRRIKQLGFASQSYPAADHSRYAHALGTMHMMRTLLTHLDVEQKLPDDFFEKVRAYFPQVNSYNMLVQHMLIAALLQDVGELPFGQVTQHVYQSSDAIREHVRKKTGFEISLLSDKEIFTVACLYDKTTKMPEILHGLSSLFLAFLVVKHFPSQFAVDQETKSSLQKLKYMLDSVVDADRLDYVFRDAHDTVGGLGTPRAIVESLLYYDEAGPVFSDPGPVAYFLTARAYLFSTVYAAPANRFHLILLSNFLQGVVQEKSCAEKFLGLPAGKLTFEDFLELDDISLNARIAEFASDLKLKRKLNAKARNALDLLVGNGIEYQCFWLPPGGSGEKKAKIDLPDELFFDTFYDQQQRIVYKPGTIRVHSGRFRQFQSPVALEKCSGPFNPIFNANHPILPMSDCILIFVPKEDSDRKGKVWQDFEQALENGDLYEELLNNRNPSASQGQSPSPGNSPGAISHLPKENNNSGQCKLPFELSQSITDFLLSLPAVQDRNAQQAFMYSAGIDDELLHQIQLGDIPIQFVQIVVQTFSQYGTLADGRNALVAILEAAKQYVGQERKAYCDTLIKELCSGLTKNNF